MLNNNYIKVNERKKLLLISSIIGIVANILLSLAKMICGFLFSNISVMADGINNLSDCGTSIVTFIGYKLAEKPADKEHPFGHARLEYITGFIISSIIMFIGFELLISSLDKILNPPLLKFSKLTIFILVMSIFVKYVLYKYNKNIGEKINSKAIIGISKDSLNDVFITLSVLFSIVIFYCFKINIDAYVGFFVAIIVIKSGLDLAKDTLSPIIGECPDKELIKKIYSNIMDNYSVLGIHDLVIHNYGTNKFFATIDIEFDSELSFVEVHEIADKIERDFESNGLKINVHADPVIINNKESKLHLNNIKKELKKIDKFLNVHGFRYVKKEEEIILFFDVEKPNNLKLSNDELTNLINSNLKLINNFYTCVIRVDEYYNYLEL